MFNYILELVEGKSYFIIINSKDQSCLKLKKILCLIILQNLREYAFTHFLISTKKDEKL